MVGDFLFSPGRSLKAICVVVHFNISNVAEIGCPCPYFNFITKLKYLHLPEFMQVLAKSSQSHLLVGKKNPKS